MEEVLAFLKNENLDHYPCTDLGGIEVWLPSRGDYQVHLPTVERDHLDSNFIITWPESEQATVDESNTDQAEDTEDTMDTGEPDGAEDTENTIDTKDTIDTEEPDGAEDTEDTMDTDEPDGTEEPDDDDNQESNASLKYRGLDPAFRTIIVGSLEHLNHQELAAVFEVVMGVFQPLYSSLVALFDLVYYPSSI